QPPHRLRRGRPVGAALRLRLPRRTRHRLQYLPYVAGARGVPASGHPAGSARGAGGHGWGDHLRGDRARRDLRGTCGHPDHVPLPAGLHRHLRRAARCDPRSVARGAGAGARPRTQRVVAVAEEDPAGLNSRRPGGEPKGCLETAVGSKRWLAGKRQYDTPGLGWGRGCGSSVRGYAWGYTGYSRRWVVVETPEVGSDNTIVLRYT